MMTTIKTKEVVKKMNSRFIKDSLMDLFTLLGFEKKTFSVAFIDPESGTPITGLKKADFSVTAVQTPSSWVANEKLEIEKVSSKPNGTYNFYLSNNGHNLSVGRWAVVIKVLNVSKTSIIPKKVINFTLF
jgi:hypothetical protein